MVFQSRADPLKTLGHLCLSTYQYKGQATVCTFSSSQPLLDWTCADAVCKDGRKLISFVHRCQEMNNDYTLEPC